MMNSLPTAQPCQPPNILKLMASCCPTWPSGDGDLPRLQIQVRHDSRNVLERFLEERCLVSVDRFFTASELHRQYNSWGFAQRKERLTRRSLLLALYSKGFREGTGMRFLCLFRGCGRKTISDMEHGHGQVQCSLDEFLRARCRLVVEPTATAAELYQEYLSWAAENLDVKRMLKKKGFGLLLSKAGFVNGRGTHGERIWRGLRLKGGIARQPGWLTLAIRVVG